jgi:hypothetical protein
MSAANRTRNRDRTARLLVILLSIAVSLEVDSALAAAGRPTWRTLSLEQTSGLRNGRGNRIEKAWASEVHIEGAAWLRILFAEANLGNGSYVMLRGPNGEQRLDAMTMKEWFNGSAVFAGDRVPIELYVAPEDRGVSIRLESVLAGDPGPGIETLCGADDRVASGDNRVGRLFQIGCTAWQIANGAFLTAGHCADTDPDGSGPMLPNGVLDLNGVLEFNVPASQSNGTLVPANANDQYPVDVTGVQWRFDGEGQGFGKDWCVFRVGRNSNTLLFPWQAYGTLPFRVTRELPTDVEAVRVTGFGTDTGTANETNQTSTGGFSGENSSGADIWVNHTVDTTGGNSGSPLIWDFMNLTFGVHTNGGCNSDGTGSNVGTSFEVDALENAIDNFPGTMTKYADQLHPLRVAEEGTLFRPFSNIGPAIAATPNNGIVSMYVGFYSLPSGTTLNRPMTFQAPAGGVVILGN